METGKDGRDQEERNSPADPDLSPPKHGMSGGNLLGFFFVLLLVLLLMVWLAFSPSSDGQANLRMADVLLALIAAVAGVWVVGGVFNLSWGGAKDIGIRAAGGAGMIFAVLLLRPFSGSDDFSECDFAQRIPFDADISALLVLAENKIGLKVNSADLEKLLRFNPSNVVGSELTLCENDPRFWNTDKTTAIEKALREIARRSSSCLTLSGPDESETLTLSLSGVGLTEDRSQNGERIIYRCRS